MRALLPVWESLVMLGPDLGKSEGREERDETKERDTGELTRMPPPQEMSTPHPLFFFFLGQTRDDESQVLETSERKIEMVTYHLPHVLFWDVVDCKSFENTD